MAARLGKSSPSHAEPEHDEEVNAWLQAYWRLRKGTHAGMAINPIMLSDLVLYFNQVNWFCSELEAWIDIMQAVDNVYLDYSNKKHGS